MTVIEHYLQIKARSQAMLDAARQRANRLRPREMTVPPSTLSIKRYQKLETQNGHAT